MLVRANNEVAVYAVHWQKIVDRKGLCIGYEALARLSGVSGSGVEKAIGVMSLSELRSLTSEVISLVCAGCAARPNSFENGPLSVFVNVEKESLTDRQLVGEVIACFEYLKARNYHLVLELTERPVSKKGLMRYIDALYRLKGAGVSLALDDYDINDPVHLELGLGVCELVKLDISSLEGFSRRAQTMLDREGERVNAKINDFFQRYSVSLLAEKVEFDWQATKVLSMPFEFFQGYYFGRPGIFD
ncbi:EAL domain-containing protein [Pseudomonas sp. NPDC090755]|uniref:EAL domain-containing protein n=1 Tax=Pseudomonas sp. NPDC090755 TaxID=3364481 RepID=UPI00383B3DF2